MNETLKVIANHRSIRSYLPQEVEAEQLDQIIRAAQAMPSSVNGQQVSVIVVRDPERKQKLSEFAEGNPWIAQAPVFLVFVIDFHKTALAAERHGKKQVIHESSEGLIVGSFDAGLAMGGAIAAAESLGLGIVPIGGVRRNAQKVIDILELPAFTFPVVGLVIGHPADRSALKPRLPEQSFRHEEKYDIQKVEKAIETYDETMKSYYMERSGKATDWSSQMADFYKQVYYPQVAPALKAQGFSLDK